MLSYQHAYHAGGFADVIKHLALIKILDYMIQKEKPMLYLDTHSGRGQYDLRDKYALKTKEAADGIEALWSVRSQLPEEFSSYIAAIQQYNPDGQLQYYPGSPALAMQRLREQDRLYFCERHPREFEHLQAFVGRHPRAHCANEDGYQQLTALLPPPERRGLIMIDPSYEVKNEYRQVTQMVKAAHRLFETGTYCIWYPIIDKRLHAQLLRGFETLDAPKQLRAEFHLNAKTPQGMDGCGLYLINAPYVLEQQLRHIFDHLLQVLHPKRSSYVIETIR
ncbi:MAG: 23S rRNA (adenine(2030)-N(6))-methyltransferase RlmJ [Legionella sp.]|nr:MAG: 23S rRNA (adenine(2030)-N(6))-methyltransferase RlmJ [Legionella sp.]